jgi:hypothetical protein
MKPIKDMNLAECIDALRDSSEFYTNPNYAYPSYVKTLADRIHDLTRWIPVSERMPTKEDFGNEFFRVWVNGTDEKACFDRGKLLVWHVEAYDAGWCEYDKQDWKTSFTHWQRITPPEGV